MEKSRTIISIFCILMEKQILVVGFSLKMYILFLTNGGEKVTREKYQELIEERIDEMQPGNVFITSDFADIAPTAATNMSLSRLKKIGKIRRILRGIYDKPRFSRLLNEPVAADPSKVAYTIARKGSWNTELPTGKKYYYTRVMLSSLILMCCMQQDRYTALSLGKFMLFFLAKN